MIEVEKVIKSVTDAFDIVRGEYEGTSYFDAAEWEEEKLVAITVLNRLMPVYPKYEPSIQGIDIKCGYCGNRMYTIRDTVSAEYPKKHVNFCSECGKGVKWDA